MLTELFDRLGAAAQGWLGGPVMLGCPAMCPSRPHNARLSCPRTLTAPTALELPCYGAQGVGVLLCDKGTCDFITFYSVLPWQLVTSQAVKIPLRNGGFMAHYCL